MEKSKDMLIIMGVQKITFAGKDGKEVNYFELYCMGSECNTSGYRLITYICPVSVLEVACKKSGVIAEKLHEHSIVDKSVQVTQTHKLKLKYLEVK